MSLRRVVSYVHPVNAPMAPPSAAASKTQRFRRWGEHGMCIETRTEVKDVPIGFASLTLMVDINQFLSFFGRKTFETFDIFSTFHCFCD